MIWGIDADVVLVVLVAAVVVWRAVTWLIGVATMPRPLPSSEAAPVENTVVSRSDIIKALQNYVVQHGDGELTVTKVGRVVTCVLTVIYTEPDKNPPADNTSMKVN